MIRKIALEKQGVVFQLIGIDRVLTGTVTHVEDDGLWMVGGDVVAHLAKSGNLPNYMKMPSVFVPAHSLVWLMAQERTDAPAQT